MNATGEMWLSLNFYAFDLSSDQHFFAKAPSDTPPFSLGVIFVISMDAISRKSPLVVDDTQPAIPSLY